MTRIYELINPSDQITFRATPLEAAFIADRMLSALYFVRDVEADKQVEAPEGMAAAYGAMWKAADQIASYARAFDSFLIGSPHNRDLFEEITAGMTAAERQARRAKWHEERRSSMNDICRKCWEAGERIAATKPDPAEAA